jgi:peptide deformylase
MAILPIRTFGDPVLRMNTALVTDIDDGVRKLVADMIETMYDAPGVGLAATQIGVSRRVCVFDANDGNGAQVLINGRIVETDGELVYDEGCLSVPGYWWEITRPEFARARGLDLEGNEVEYSGTGLMGRVLQHELDHLDGTLLIERLEPAVRKQALRELRNQALGLVDLGE